MSVVSFIPKHHRFKLTSLQQNQVRRFITRSLEKETPVTFCMTIHALIINLFCKYMSKTLEPWGLILVIHASNDNRQSMLIKTFVYRRSFLYEITFLDINIKNDLFFFQILRRNHSDKTVCIDLLAFVCITLII